MARKAAAPLLSAEWTNARFANVLNGALQMVDRILDSIYVEGFGPLEQPITKKDIRQMAEVELAEVLDQQLTMGSKAELLKDIAES